jgi:CRP/FNR family cyclic AMP-dependent transcriptional regulator
MMRDTPFLHGLDADDQAALRELGITRTFEPEASLFRQGDHSDHVLIVTKGRVKIATLRPGVGDVVLAERRAGDVLGELSAIDSQPRSADAVAIDDVVTLSLTNDDFKVFLRQRAAAAFALLEALAYRLRAADRRDVEFSDDDTVGRVARAIRRLADERAEANGPWRLVPMSDAELAADLQGSAEQVRMSLDVLEKEGVIEAHRRGVTVINEDALQARAG